MEGGAHFSRILGAQVLSVALNSTFHLPNPVRLLQHYIIYVCLSACLRVCVCVPLSYLYSSANSLGKVALMTMWLTSMHFLSV